jgi:predicted RNase H-like nuclease (RuvC/YqgF family)
MSIARRKQGAIARSIQRLNRELNEREEATDSLERRVESVEDNMRGVVKLPTIVARVLVSPPGLR